VRINNLESSVDIMKLIVQIPAFNEESNIGKTLQNLPRKISGIDNIEILVIDDGSTDKTVVNAQNEGVDKIISHKQNIGVGSAFMTGIRNAISMNADIVVTIDADSQFDSSEIPKLIRPILNKQFDVVIGSRFLNNQPKHMPKIKLVGNKIFSSLTSFALGQKFTDTQTGFRAYSREAVLAISVVNEFTYTQEVLIDLKFKGFKIGEVPVSITYDSKRKSRVVKNIFNYSSRAISIIFRSLVFHRPILIFGLFSVLLISIGTLAKLFTITKIFQVTAGLSSGFIILGVVSFMMGLFASVVFKRQMFTEKDLRHHINELIKSKD